ncbi:MAG: hypothetical protein H0U74_18195, partial [Bradymonadaceae bacterium]|nr:hypothetical protein [Lujinxingiaceae bacterium]
MSEQRKQSGWGSRSWAWRLCFAAFTLAFALGRPAVAQDDEGAEGLTAREAAEAPFIGKPIGHIAFNCDLELCRSPVAVERFRELSGLYVGQPYTPQNARRGQERLAKTGFFQSLDYTKELSGGRVMLSIEARGATLIRKVSFQGLSPPPFETELRKLLIYRPGQPYTNDSEKAQAQLSSLQAVFEREGYFGSSIRMIVQRIEVRAHLVDLVFSIDKGNELKICEIGLRGVRAMSYSQAREQLLTNVSALAKRVPLFPPTFTTHDFRAGREALIQRYRQLGYFRVRIVDQAINTDLEGGCVEIVLDVSEGPNWAISFEGNVLFKHDELLAQLPFFDSGYVDREEIARAQNALRKLYETRGYPFAKVVGAEQREDRDVRSIVFTIEEGPQLQISSVIIHDNPSLNAARLKEGFGTQPFGLFDSGGYLQTDQLVSDFAKLEAVYRKRGFLQASVVRFDLETTTKGDALNVHIHVNEGKQTRAERVDVTGARVVPEGTLLALLDVSTGRAFVPLNVRADQSRIVQHYASIGYPMARVTTSCRLLTGEEVACEAPQLPPKCKVDTLDELQEMCVWRSLPTATLICQRMRDDAHCSYEGGAIDERIRVRHHVEEGPRVRVGEVLLKGNFKTSAELIYRELPLKTGDLFNVSKVLEGQANMRSLGLFDSVSIEA